MITTLSDTEIMQTRSSAVELITSVFPEFRTPSIIVPLLVEYSDIRPTLYNSFSQRTPSGVEFRRSRDLNEDVDSICLIRMLLQSSHCKLLLFIPNKVHVQWQLTGSIHEIEHAITIAGQANFNYLEFYQRIK